MYNPNPKFYFVTTLDFLCRRTASMEHAADTAEPAAVDQYFSSPTENFFVPVCLRTPGYRLTIVL